MKTLSREQAKQKIERYCAYQERSHQEVKNKLYSYGLYRNEVDEVMTDLITDGFLSEARFAKAFAGGKFRMKKWGRIKIVHALESKGVSRNCIRIGLKEITDEDYAATLRSLLEEKLPVVEAEAENIYLTRDRLSKFVIQKGFEPELVWQAINKLVPR